MGVDLRSETGESFYLNNTAWRYVMVLAAEHGWHDPSGDDDALNADQAGLLAEALATATNGRTADDISQQLTTLLVTPTQSSMFPADPIKVTPASLEHLRLLITFLRKGGFRME